MRASGGKRSGEAEYKTLHLGVCVWLWFISQSCDFQSYVMDELLLDTFKINLSTGNITESHHYTQSAHKNMFILKEVISVACSSSSLEASSSNATLAVSSITLLNLPTKLCEAKDASCIMKALGFNRAD